MHNCRERASVTAVRNGDVSYGNFLSAPLMSGALRTTRLADASRLREPGTRGTWSARTGRVWMQSRIIQLEVLFLNI